MYRWLLIFSWVNNRLPKTDGIRTSSGTRIVNRTTQLMQEKWINRLPREETRASQGASLRLGAQGWGGPLAVRPPCPMQPGGCIRSEAPRVSRPVRRGAHPPGSEAQVSHDGPLPMAYSAGVIHSCVCAHTMGGGRPPRWLDYRPSPSAVS